jgi:RNA polymerase sigma-70 factor (ECF subfamily)
MGVAPQAGLGCDGGLHVHSMADAGIDVLVARAVGGDAAAVESLLTEIQPFVVRYCRSGLPNTIRSIASAEDVAQEVCIAVLTALPSFRQSGKPFIAFVYGIAAHKVADAHRAVRRSRSLSFAEVPDTPAVEPGPEQSVMAGSTTAIMNELLYHLTATEREILRLRIVVGLSADATAAAIGSTAGAVRVAQHRALSKLRVLLSKDAELTEQLV